VNDPSPAPQPGFGRNLSDRLVIGGGVVFVVGLLALALAMVLFVREGLAPGVVAGLAMLCPIGFAISFWGLVVQARERRRS
jgi:hypothetical protein